MQMSTSSHQDVVRLNVRVQNAAPFHQLQRQEQLLCIWADGLDVKPDVFAVLLQNFSQIHTDRQQLLLQSG